MGATRLKLDESIYFLEQMESNRFNPPHSGYYLSAFISASRSVLWVMRNEFYHVDGWLEWYESKESSPDEKRFLENLNELRIRTVKKGTPSVDYGIDVYIPPGELTGKKKESLQRLVGQAVTVTVYTDDEQPPGDTTESGVSFHAHLESVYPQVSDFSGDDILGIGKRYITWLSNLVDECETKFGTEKSLPKEINPTH